MIGSGGGKRRRRCRCSAMSRRAISAPISAARSPWRWSRAAAARMGERLWVSRRGGAPIPGHRHRDGLPCRAGRGSECGAWLSPIRRSPLVAPRARSPRRRRRAAARARRPFLGKFILRADPQDAVGTRLRAALGLGLPVEPLTSRRTGATARSSGSGPDEWMLVTAPEDGAAAAARRARRWPACTTSSSMSATTTR